MKSYDKKYAYSSIFENSSFRKNFFSIYIIEGKSFPYYIQFVKGKGTYFLLKWIDNLFKNTPEIVELLKKLVGRIGKVQKKKVDKRP